MDLQNIQTFICVAKLGNFSKAAEELSYAQSTVTAQIQHLETELGFKLFERVGRKNYLTSGGKEFLLYATEMMHLFQKSSSIGKELKKAKGILKIGVLESLLFANLLPIIQKFQQEFPNLEIVIKMGQTFELLSMMEKNQLDIIYISKAINSDSGTKSHYRRREELIFTSAPSHQLSKRKAIAPEEIFSCPFVTTEPAGYCFGRLQEIASEHCLTLQHNITVDSISAIVTLLKDNKSIAFLPEYAIKTELENGTLVKLNTGVMPQFYYSQLLCPKEKWISPFIERLICLINEEYPETN